MGERSYLFRNNGDLTFSEISRQVGFNHALQGRGLVTLDHDNDGDQDILIFNNEGGMSLFCNAGAGSAGNWLRIFLDTSDADGSRVSVRAAGMVQYRHLDGGSNYLGLLRAVGPLRPRCRAPSGGGARRVGQRRSYRAASRACQPDHDGHPSRGEGEVLQPQGVAANLAVGSVVDDVVDDVIALSGTTWPRPTLRPFWSSAGSATCGVFSMFSLYEIVDN